MTWLGSQESQSILLNLGLEINLVIDSNVVNENVNESNVNENNVNESNESSLSESNAVNKGLTDGNVVNEVTNIDKENGSPVLCDNSSLGSSQADPSE